MNIMRLNINHFSILALFIFSLTFQNGVLGQTDNKNMFEIGSLTVVGAKFSDENAIKTISGLRVGDVIQVPGPKITRAVKSLINLKLFTNVEIIQEKIIGEVIFLQIKVEERPRLIGWSFSGIKKSYASAIGRKKYLSNLALNL